MVRRLVDLSISEGDLTPSHICEGRSSLQKGNGLPLVKVVPRIVFTNTTFWLFSILSYGKEEEVCDLI